MTNVQVSVEHELGAAQATERLRKAADELRKKNSSLVKSLEWSGNKARVTGSGFEGSLTVGEKTVAADVELGFPANMMPLKARQEVEAWLRGVLA